MKRVLSIVFQFLVYLIAFAVGSFPPLFHLPAIIWHLSATRDFVITGLILSAALFVLVMAVHAVRRPHSSALLNSTIAFVLAIAAGVALKFGLLTV